MRQSQLEKVTVFLTRGAGEATELLVFRHERSGVQVPAGTADPDESPEDAARRELAEETGLTAVRLMQSLGQIADDLMPQERGVTQTEPLRLAPAADSKLTGGTVYRGMTVPCSEESGGYTRVGLLEWEDLEQDPWVLASEQWGWVSNSSLCGRRVRHFYHFAPMGATPDTWSQQAPDGDNGDFALYWVPLVPRPGLVRPQDEWLNAWYDRLTHATSDAKDEPTCW